MGGYKNVGNHAEDLADGRMIGPGETVDLDDDAIKDPHNERLLEEGVFIRIDDEQQPDATDEAVKLAKASKIPLSAITGTGSNGRIIASDVERTINEQKGGNAS